MYIWRNGQEHGHANTTYIVCGSQNDNLTHKWVKSLIYKAFFWVIWGFKNDPTMTQKMT
jgi:hypothetical protein